MMSVDRGNEPDRRLLWVVRGAGLVFILLFARFFTVAILNHDRYVVAADSQHVVNKEVLPERGSIVTADGSPLATDVVNYSASVVPKNIRDKWAFAATLAPELGMEVATLFDLINNDNLYLPPIKKGLTPEQADKIGKLNLVGLYLVPEHVRFYPEGDLGAHLLGFVNAEGLGQYGVEGFYDNLLRGFKGSVRFEKDRKGRAITLEEYLAQARDGTSVVLTLDRNLQYVVEQRLSAAMTKFQADGGSVVVLNAQNGEVLAMASRPNFDPNKFSEAADISQYLNPAVQSTWEPGSVLKPLAMAAALNENLVSPETTGTFGSSVTIDGWTINTAQNKAFGTETMTQVLENSDNVAMVWVADKLGSDKYYQYLKNYGFDDKTGVDLMGEADPQILPLKEWRNISRATMSFGQGIAITPLQLVAAYAALGNGGKLWWPHVVKSYLSPDGKTTNVEPKEIRRVISEETSRTVAAMLVSVVERGHGKRARVDGYRIAGKTGTAQVPAPTGGYDENKHVGSFCGFAPAENPVFAMCVKLDTPKNVDWAEASAAPVFGEIAGWILANYNVKPTP